MAYIGKNILSVHPEVARRTLKKIDEQCSLYYIIIGSVYNLAQSSMVDAVAEMRADKTLWRHEVKRDANLALNAYKAWDQKMRLRLADRYQLWLDMSDAVADSLKADVQKLLWSFDALLMKHSVSAHRLCAAVLTAVAMNDIADLTFRKFLADSSKATGINMAELFSRESSFTSVKSNWEKATRPILRSRGARINPNDDTNCRLAADIISRRLADIQLYEQACGYGASLNTEVIKAYLEP